MTTVTFAVSLTHELQDRLLWTARLRWLAAGGLAGASVAGPALGLPALWPPLLILAAIIAAYNLGFQRFLRHGSERARSYYFLRAVAIWQIVLDLLGLLVTVYYSGGTRSPVLFFFVFHMAIGTMLLDTRTMYKIAAGTCSGVLLIYLGSAFGLLTQHPAGTPFADWGHFPLLNMLGLPVVVFGTVYLTGTVTARSIERSIQLLETTMQLGDRTAALERALGEIKELEARKSHYMRISAHQLRSPLGTIKTSLGVLTQGYADPASERGRRLLEGATERVGGLLAIVNDLLELAKIREGKAKAPWSRNLNINRLLKEALGGIKPYADRQKVRLVGDIREAAIIDWGVAPDLRFAIENLIQNAIKYSRTDDEVRVTLRVDDETAVLIVTDEGIGIPAELQQDVFLEFVRAPNAKRHAPEGTGLGLPIALEAVGMHSGTIELESEVDVGTTFTVTLPLHNAPPPFDETRERIKAEEVKETAS